MFDPENEVENDENDLDRYADEYEEYEDMPKEEKMYYKSK